MNAATDLSDPKPAKKKGGGLVRILGFGLAFVAGSAAGGFGAILAASQLGLGGSSASHAEAAPAKPPPSPVEYVEIDNSFTTNLIDTGRYLQIRLSVSTTDGPDAVAAIGQHKPAIISSVLAVLGEAAEADVADRIAKDKLRGKLKIIINDVLKSNGALGGVDEVFFTSMVVQ